MLPQLLNRPNRVYLCTDDAFKCHQPTMCTMVTLENNPPCSSWAGNSVPMICLKNIDLNIFQAPAWMYTFRWHYVLLYHHIIIMYTDLMISMVVFFCMALLLCVVGFGVFCYACSLVAFDNLAKNWKLSTKWAGILIFLAGKILYSSLNFYIIQTHSTSVTDWLMTQYKLRCDLL